MMPKRRSCAVSVATKTLFVAGLGAMGNRFARLVEALERRVCGFRKTASLGQGDADTVHATVSC